MLNENGSVANIKNKYNIHNVYRNNCPTKYLLYNKY